MIHVARPLLDGSEGGLGTRLADPLIGKVKYMF